MNIIRPGWSNSDAFVPREIYPNSSRLRFLSFKTSLFKRKSKLKIIRYPRKGLKPEEYDFWFRIQGEDGGENRPAERKRTPRREKGNKKVRRKLEQHDRLDDSQQRERNITTIVTTRLNRMRFRSRKYFIDH